MAQLTWKGKGARRAARPATLVTEETHAGPAQGAWRDRLVLGAAERVLPALAAELRGKVALAYVDPPFDTGGSFEYLATVGDGSGERLAIPAYSDARGRDAWLDWFSHVAAGLRALLADGGSLYVHLDAHVAHYAKVVLDEVFGAGAFQREIIWRIGWVSGFKSRARAWIRNHDTLLFYAKGGRPRTFHKEYVAYPPGYRRRDGAAPTGKGVPIDDVWNASEADRLDSIQIMSFSGEKVGYPTQKNEALLGRIVRASSDAGDLVLDCCAGSGTTAVVASRLGRRWIVCDAGALAVHVARKRLASARGVGPFAVERDARLALPPEGTVHVRPLVAGRACTLSVTDYHRASAPAALPRDWKQRLDGWCVDWGDGSPGGAGPLDVAWSAWRDRRGDLVLTASHRYAEPGKYRVRVRAFDLAGGSATHAVTVRV